MKKLFAFCNGFSHNEDMTILGVRSRGAHVVEFLILNYSFLQWRKILQAGMGQSQRNPGANIKARVYIAKANRDCSKDLKELD